MKKIVLIPTTDEISVGDLVSFKVLIDEVLKTLYGTVFKFVDEEWIGVRFLDRKTNKLSTCGVLREELTKVHTYIVDTEIEIVNGDWVIKDKSISSFNEDELHRCIERALDCINDCKWFYKIIATNNPALPLPQLSKEAIELIVEKNGELGEFDVDLLNVKPL